MWCGETEIPAASNLLIKAALGQRTASSEWCGSSAVDSIVLPDGRKLMTLRDAAEYITALPKAEHDGAADCPGRGDARVFIRLGP